MKPLNLEGREEEEMGILFLICLEVYKNAIPSPQALAVVAAVKTFYFKYKLDILYINNYQNNFSKF